MSFSRIISFIFHPVFMPLAGIYLMLSFGGWLSMIPAHGKVYIYAVVAVTTMLLPLMMIPVLLRAGLISSIYLTERTERRIPFLGAALLYLIGAFTLQKIEAPIILSLYLNGSSMVILVLAIINWWWKVSAHMAGIGGVTGMVLAISMRWMLNEQLILAALFLIAGLIGYARLKEDEHTPAQVYVGYLVGLTVNFLLIRLV